MGQVRSLLEELSSLVEDDVVGPYEQGVDDGFASGIAGKKSDKPPADKGEDFAKGFARGLNLGMNVRSVTTTPDTDHAHRSALHILKHYYDAIIKAGVGKKLGLDPGDVAGHLAAHDIPSRIGAFARNLSQGKTRPHLLGKFLKTGAKFTASHLADRGKEGALTQPLPAARAVGSFTDLPSDARAKSHHRTKSPYGKDSHYAAPLGQIQPGVPVTGGKTTFDIPAADKPLIKQQVSRLIREFPAKPQQYHPKAQPQEFLKRVFLGGMGPRDALGDMGIEAPAAGSSDEDTKRYGAIEMWANRLMNNFAAKAREDKILKSFVHNPDQFARGRDDKKAKDVAAKANRQTESMVSLLDDLAEAVDTQRGITQWIDWLQAAA